MRFRLLVSLPLSFLIVGLLLVSASTLFAAGQASAPPAPSGPSEMVGSGAGSAIVRCDRLRREIHALSHEVTPCELGPECHGSPLLCPIALDLRIEREYAHLRAALEAECGVPPERLDFAWEAGATFDLADRCALVHDGWEAAASGEAAPAIYTF